ncbi:MAG: hypothetical protein U5L11_01330 [Arhodomonas sp.]|nr:hypothetical protein [Arhodomonas sp.]
MDAESYHHWMILTPPLTGDGGEWLARGLADARATLLHRLELTSARLRLRGLRLHVAAATPPDVRIPAQGSLGLALTIVDVDDSLRVREALYGREAEGWRRLWLAYEPDRRQRWRAPAADAGRPPRAGAGLAAAVPGSGRIPFQRGHTLSRQQIGCAPPVFL